MELKPCLDGGCRQVASKRRNGIKIKEWKGLEWNEVKWEGSGKRISDVYMGMIRIHQIIIETSCISIGVHQQNEEKVINAFMKMGKW